MKTVKKLVIALLFIAVIITISTNVQAVYFEIYAGETNVQNHRFDPYKIFRQIYGRDDDTIFYCVQAGSPYNAQFVRGSYTEGQTSGNWCDDETQPAAPFDGVRKSMEYTTKESGDANAYQDTAYVIASAAEAGKLEDMATQWSIWNTSINIGHGESNKGQWGEEAIAYKNFYHTIHSGTTDIYSSKIFDKTNTSAVNVHVDQTSKTYIVGPFIIEYPNGDYSASGQKWSYITNITLLNQSNNEVGNVVNDTIHIINQSGTELTDTIRNKNFPNSNEEFYVKFSSTLGDINNMNLKVDFAYLESCSANWDIYEGQVCAWSWEICETGNTHTHTVHTHGNGCYNALGKLTCDEDTEETFKEKTWKLTKTTGSKPQRLMAYVGNASKNYSTASLIVAPGTDLTMKISGQVFLDKDTGKVNTGNNVMEGSEVLSGVEVVLYDAETNQVVTRTNQVAQYHIHTASCYSTVAHVHTGDPYTGGGCYTTRIHYHDGNWEDGGACYSNAVAHVHTGSSTPIITVHRHTGNAQTGGGCYTNEVIHEHTDDCYSIRTYGRCPVCQATSGDYGWQNSVTCQNCGQASYDRREERTLICGKEETTEYSLGCGYKEGEIVYTGSGCYTVPVYHTHTDACYTIGHTHTDSCYSESSEYCGEWERDDAANGAYCSGCGAFSAYCPGGYSHYETTKELTCGKTESATVLKCGYTEGQIERYELGCGASDTTVKYYELTCTEPLYGLSCNNASTSVLTCGKSNTIEGTTSTTLVNPAITDSNGYYEFAGLDAMKKYYVKFVYNGMLYTNVNYDAFNTDTGSKADETSRYNSRVVLNNQFSEIGSYPSNYKIQNKVFNDIGDYNKVYLQEDIVEIFKKISENMVGTNTDNIIGACQNTYNQLVTDSKYSSSPEELKRKIQFAADCRISAYTVKNYPLTDKFTISSTGKTVDNIWYAPIYSGTYNQLHVNLGIKARPTFDLALYKDVFNATLNINGKQEIYTYDARKDWQNNGFSYGVNEEYYLNQLREKYMNGTDTNITTKEVVDEGNYSHEYRTEEIVNGNNQNEAINESVLYNSSSQYSWRDMNYNLADSDKLQIHVTYKLSIRNQSSVIGAITELVDYYDSHYQFEGAYVGDENGNKIGDVETSTTSMYGDATLTSAKTGTWKVGINQETTNYNTIYLRPVAEQKLYQDNETQYIYVTFGLTDPENTLIEAGLPDGNRFYTYNMAEINGYKTYGTFEEGPNITASSGLIDRDSNPGNFNPSTYVFGQTALEDDESRAPAYAYSIRNSRTIEGTVFEDTLAQGATASKEEYTVNVATTRFGTGTIEDKDKKIAGVKVELIELKDTNNDGTKEMYVRSTTYTDNNGWYGFGGFLPGDYTIRFTYGEEDMTALTTTSQYTQGLNDTSYNGQEYQSTIFTTALGQTTVKHNYTTDSVLNGIYTVRNQEKNREESNVNVSSNQTIMKYEADGYYWYDDASIANQSDATDDTTRRSQVTAYSETEYGVGITNHKAEVFNAYINHNTLREVEEKDKNFDEFTQAQPMDAGVDTENKNRELVDELERRTYMYAYTPEIPIEVEYTTKTIAGNQSSDKYTYKIAGVDFGVVERPRAQLTIDQDIAHIKVTATDGTTLLELNNNNGKIEVVVDNGNNYQWVSIGKDKQYDKDELINVILDDELLNGAKLEITYKITVTNNSESGTGTTRASNIINYVANNLNFDLSDNNGLWEVVKKEEIQTDSHATWINNETGANNTKLVDLSTQTTVLKATASNPLVSTNLQPGDSAWTTLTLKKTLSAESSNDNLSYSNLTEIVEIDNTTGRYDHGAIPGNQSLEEQPREHDTSGASSYDEADNIKKRYPPDGEVIVTPPTGSTMIYYVLGITATVILAAGIFIIKKFVIGRKK